MLLRLLGLVTLFSAVLAKPCAKTDDCTDDFFSCGTIFPTGPDGSPSPKCFDPTDGDYQAVSFCPNTCQICCPEITTSTTVLTTTEEPTTTDAPLTTTELLTTTEPLTTTEASLTTTEQFTTTEEPLTTTEEPLTTTEQVLTTTEEPQTTTEEPLTTTEEPQTTTEQLTTTEKVLTTTEEILTTTQEAEEPFSTAQPLPNPCATRQLTGCDDAITSCPVVFPNGPGGAPNQKCFDAEDGDFSMTPFCRKTCQLCCQEPKFNCNDDPIPGIACSTTEDDCNVFGDISWDHCRSSCGWCDREAKPCVDLITNCADYKAADLCSEPEVMSQCEKSCHVCAVPGCVDSTDRCDIWTKNGFCDDPFYIADRAAYCQKSCDLC